MKNAITDIIKKIACGVLKQGQGGKGEKPGVGEISHKQ